MRRDQMNFTACELRLLVGDVTTERVSRENASVGGLPIVFHLPITDEYNHRLHPDIDVAVLFDESVYLGGVAARLAQRIFLFRESTDKQAFAVSKSDFACATPELGLDREHAAWPN